MLALLFLSYNIAVFTTKTIDMLIKKYPRLSLTSPLEEVSWRVDFIQKITSNTEAPVTFSLDNGCFIRYTKRVKGKHIQYGNLNEEQATTFADIMNECHQKGFVHGDLNKKNIFISKSGKLVVSDWEPDLNQIIEGRQALMGTLPWIDKNDLITKKITHNTDLLCFYRILTNCKKAFAYTEEWKNLQKKASKSKIPYTVLLNHLYSSQHSKGK